MRERAEIADLCTSQVKALELGQLRERGEIAYLCASQVKSSERD